MQEAFSDRLPQIVVPRHYKLQLDPDKEDMTFSGSVDITFEHVDKTQPLPNELR